MIGGDGINDESNKTAPAPTRNTDLTKYTKKHPRPAPEVYLRFEGRILTVPEVYFRFKGLVILHTTSIRSITPTPFRRFYALSTWTTAP